MKRIISLLTAMVMCAALVCPVFAENFVPSIDNKDGPGIENAVIDGGDSSGEDISGSLIVSSIIDAIEEATNIDQETRDQLLELYKKLDEGSMELPLTEEESGYVIRELVDISHVSGGDATAEEEFHQWLAQVGNTITITFDMGVKGTTDVSAFVWVDGTWIRVENVVNNGDGTVTCVFEDIGPVAFCVDPGAEEPAPDTGDSGMQDIILWVVLLAVSAGALVVLLVLRRRQKH